MRIDELHKFSDGTLNDVRNALDDRLKGIQMQYLPSTIWRKGDKDRAAAIIQAIEKMLKTRRIMRSLEKFVGGRLEGNEPESASDLQETATTSASRSTQGSQSQQTSASEFAAPEEPMQTTFEMEEPAHPDDGTLTNVHTALDDHLKGIRMQCLPQSIWRKSDKDRAEAMIQAIDKRLKTRRIMRSLE
nr:hypothetical protein [Tanacetum cinerariifolium]